MQKILTSSLLIGLISIVVLTILSVGGQTAVAPDPVKPVLAAPAPTVPADVPAWASGVQAGLCLENMQWGTKQSSNWGLIVNYAQACVSREWADKYWNGHGGGFYPETNQVFLVAIEESPERLTPSYLSISDLWYKTINIHELGHVWDSQKLSNESRQIIINQFGWQNWDLENWADNFSYCLGGNPSNSPEFKYNHTVYISQENCDWLRINQFIPSSIEWDA